LPELLNTIRLADILDIAVIATLFYVAMRWLVRRSSLSVALGIGVFAAVYVTAHVLEMRLTLILFQVGVTVLLIVLAVVFQRELRRGFERLATWRPVAVREPTPEGRVADVLVEAVKYFTETCTGALIVLRGLNSLEPHVRGGVALDARPSVPLLLSLFHEKSPAHDGAVLVENGRLTRFAAHLPLSTEREKIGRGGTRHAAALGLAEQCDALVLVVSEERGVVSLAHEGELRTLGSPNELRQNLGAFEEGRSAVAAPGGPRRWPNRFTALKFLAVACACLLWLGLVYDVETVQRTVTDVPIDYRGTPKDWAVKKAKPNTVAVTIKGPERAFDDFDPRRIRVALDVSNLTTGWQQVTLGEQVTGLPSEVETVRITPTVIELSADRLVEVKAPVRVVDVGRLPEDLKLVSRSVEPAEVVLRVEENLKLWTQYVPTEALRLDDITTAARINRDCEAWT